MDRRDFLRLSAAATAGAALSPLAQVTPPGPLRALDLRALESSAGFLARAPGTNPFRETPRSSFAWSKVGDKLYILGGHLGEYHAYPEEYFSRELLEYDFGTDSWRRLADYPYGVQGLRMVDDGRFLYAFGGFRYSGAFDYTPDWKADEIHWSAVSSDDVYRFDTLANAWTRVATLPRRRSSNVLIKSGRQVFLVAGWDGTLSQRGNTRNPVFHSMVDVFDLDKLTFLPHDRLMTEPVRRALTSAVFDGKLALLGGLGRNPDGLPALINNATIFDPSTGAFSDITLPALRTPLFSAGACFTGTKIVVAGGQPTFSSINATVYTLAPGDACWSTSPGSLSQEAMFVELLPISGGEVLAFGGHGYPKPLGLWERIKV